MPRLHTTLAACALAVLFGATDSASQDIARDTVPSVPAAALPALGGVAEERERLATLFGEPGAPYSLIRSPSSILAPLPGSGVRVTPLQPRLRAAWNSALPLSMNDGALWAGRGTSVSVEGGVRMEAGPVSLVLAPSLVYAENADFDHLSIADPAFSALLPPWRRGRFSADLPLRPGTEPRIAVDPGQTTLTLSSRTVAGGLSTEEQWWGPGVRNAIVMSNNAPGFPHVFLRSAQPLCSAVGRVEWKWMVGSLVESGFFDFDEENDGRTLSAFAATLTPRGEPGLTLGLARSVVVGGSGARWVMRGLPAVFVRWPPPDTAVTGRRREMQLFSLFARWVFPGDGMEVYAEWARHEAPASLRDLFVAPQHTQGYTLGMQWAAPPAGAAGGLRVQAEATNLEQSSTFRVAPRPSFYASPSVRQGYTHRGRTIGAAIGPGASSQWLAIDWLAAAGGGGAYVNRIRWDNDAYYESPMGWTYHAHDVSVILGARGHLRTRFGDVGAEALRETRLNYHFQNPTAWPGGADAVDVVNYAMRFSFTPRP